MTLLSINPYNEFLCKKIVIDNFESKIEQKFSKWKINDYRKFYYFTDEMHLRQTPRLSLVKSVIPCASFYYLNYLLETDPSEIIDIGCGPNFFKDILPNIIGIDVASDYADIKDHFDQEFSLGHTNNFDCAFSIDALHFISIDDFYNRILEFANIIKPGGRGYIALNSARMIDHTAPTVLKELFGTTVPTQQQIATYFDQQIKKLPIKFLVVDNLIIEKMDEFIDGNIRIVFEK